MKTALFRLKELTKTVNSEQLSGRKELGVFLARSPFFRILKKINTLRHVPCRKPDEERLAPPLHPCTPCSGT
jgi:hypothetical protein